MVLHVHFSIVKENDLWPMLYLVFFRKLFVLFNVAERHRTRLILLLKNSSSILELCLKIKRMLTCIWLIEAYDDPLVAAYTVVMIRFSQLAHHNFWYTAVI